jgi:hypothetical protein
VSFKAREVLVIVPVELPMVSTSMLVRRRMDDALLEPSDDEEEEGT